MRTFTKAFLKTSGTITAASLPVVLLVLFDYFDWKREMKAVRAAKADKTREPGWTP